MLYVPSHTSEVGTFHVRDPITHWDRLRGTVFPNVQPNARPDGALITRVSEKSVTGRGFYSAQYPSFRKPTAYRRVVMRSEDAGGGYDFSTGKDTDTFYWQYYGSDGRGSSFLRPSVGPVNLGGGNVDVSLNTRNRATAEALNKLTDMKVNLGTALGEVKTTINMVAQTFSKLARFIHALRRGRWRAARYALFGTRHERYTGKTASDLWLEWRYGWSPLISDVLGGVELIREGFRSKDLVFNVSRTITTPLDPARFITVADRTSRVVVEGEAYESCRVELWGAVKSELSYLNSLGLINPLSLAWELTTLSFVVDWLIPIGSWLESLTATVGIEFVGGYRNHIVSADVEGQLETYGGAVIYGKFPRIRNRVMAFQRYPLESWPWAFPYWVDPLSSSHLTSAMALLRQRRA